MAQKLLTVQLAAERAVVSERTVREWLRAGLIPGAAKFGKLWRIPEEALDECLRRGAGNAEESVARD